MWQIKFNWERMTVVLQNAYCIQTVESTKIFSNFRNSFVFVGKINIAVQLYSWFKVSNKF